MKPVALVTGSSRGIGHAIAVKLAQSGYRLIIHGSGLSPALTTSLKVVQKYSPKSVSLTFDVCQAEAVSSAIRQILAQVGPISVLVNNAGITRDRTVVKMSTSEWDRVIQTNLSSAFYTTKAVLPAMKTQGFGRIINISSVVAYKGNFGQANYAAAKAGLIGFTKALSREVARSGITVNAVCPGLIQTEMTEKIPEIYRQHLLSQVGQGKMGQPDDVANLVAFLASVDSAYVTGSVFTIHGGWL